MEPVEQTPTPPPPAPPKLTPEQQEAVHARIDAAKKFIVRCEQFSPDKWNVFVDFLLVKCKPLGIKERAQLYDMFVLTGLQNVQIVYTQEREHLAPLFSYIREFVEYNAKSDATPTGADQLTSSDEVVKMLDEAPIWKGSEKDPIMTAALPSLLAWWTALSRSQKLTLARMIAHFIIYFMEGVEKHPYLL